MGLGGGGCAREIRFRVLSLGNIDGCEGTGKETVEIFSSSGFSVELYWLRCEAHIKRQGRRNS